MTGRESVLEKITYDEIAQNRLLDLVTTEMSLSFLAHAYDDDGRKMYESMLHMQKLFKRNVPVEMHLFTKMGCDTDLTGSEEICAARLAEAL